MSQMQDTLPGLEAYKDIPTLEDAIRVTTNEDFFLGSGSCRRVYRDPESQWVYKVDAPSNGYYDRGSNSVEWGVYQQITSGATEVPDGVEIPECHLLPNGILAMRYISGYAPSSECEYGNCVCSDSVICWYDLATAVTDDAHAGNVIVDDMGVIWVIDFGW